MPVMNGIMDLVISPILTNNNALNSISNINGQNQSEQIEAFEKIFDDINEQFDKEIEDMLSPQKTVKDEKKENKTEDNLLNLLGNNFGPPMGLNIENFDYSLIQ